MIYLRINANKEERQPKLKGFVKLNQEMLDYLNSVELDDDGEVMLDIALWKSQGKEGVFTGKVQKPYKQPPLKTEGKMTQETKDEKQVESNEDDELAF